MAIPDYQALMLPVLRASRRETKVPEAAKQIADELSLTDAEREEMLPSGRQRLLHNRIHWAKFYMSKAGLIDTPRRGCFVTSKSGEALLAQNPEQINVELLKNYSAFREFYEKSNEASELEQTFDVVTASAATPEEQIDAAYLKIQAALKADLLQRVLAQSPVFLNG